MGTTIKRQPVNFKIPSSPDYKYLNITDFGGISISDNPFTLNPNTASDSLNVYIDETNTLTTRPRLQKHFRVSENTTDILNVFNCSAGYICQFGTSGAYSNLVYYDLNGNTNTIINSFIPNIKVTMFEQDNYVYFLSGNGYYRLNLKPMDGLYELEEPEPYIPTTTVGKNRTFYNSDNVLSKDLQGTNYESFNLLTNKYKETYFWDGISNVFDDVNTVDGINDTYSKLNLGNIFEKTVILNYYPETKTLLGVEYDYGDMYLKYYQFNEDLTQITATLGSTPLPAGALITIDITAKNTPSLVIYDELNESFNVYYWNEATATIDKLLDSDILLSDNGLTPSAFGLVLGTMSPNGSYVIIRGNLGTKTNGALYKINYEDKTITYKYSWGLTDEDFVWSYINDKNQAVVVRYSSDENKLRLDYATNIDDISAISVLDTIPVQDVVFDVDDLLLYDAGITNKHFYINTTAGLLMYDIDNDMNKTAHLLPKDIGYVTLSETNGWFVKNDDMFIIPDITNMTDYYNSYIPVVKYEQVPFYVELGNMIIMDEGLSTSIYKLTPHTEPTVTLIKTIQQHDDVYQSWKEKHDAFITSNITTRFQNNRWFATSNKTFYTKNNNPTYIPIDSYNELDNSDEIITGFNIVEDNTLVAYKPNSLYVIQPTVINNTSTYLYTVTKNTVGNDIMNAPIVTTLTETPLHVSFDGIFALNQLENVQSSDRIAVLFNENINQKWLIENKDDLKNLITMNKLYWTFFIIPHEEKKIKTPVGEIPPIIEYSGYTRVYVLDNRTQKWFYWEFPVCVKNAFVQNNDIHVAANDGVIYTLKTNETLHEHNPNRTEYFDDGRVIIPWYWRSQILHLGTMNYSKKLISTTFIFTDTDSTDEYSLNYKFRIFRKTASDTTPTTITNKLNYVQSTTKKTFASRFNFIQIELSNTEEDLNSNKLRLIGLGLKYELLEGLS